MPFFYFFVRNTLSGDNTLNKKDILHFIPSLIHFIELIPFYLIPYPDKMRIAQEIVNQPIKLDLLASSLIPGFWIDFSRLLLQIFYFILSLKLLKSNKINTNWGVEGINIRNWLLVAVFLIGCVLFSHIMYFLKEFLIESGHKVSPLFNIISYILIIIPICSLNIYLRVNQHLVYGYTIPEIFQQNNTIVTDNLVTTEKEFNNSKNLIPASLDLNLLYINLQHLMNEEKIYLNRELSLSDLANKLNVNQRILSQFIKTKFNLGVRDYINQFRIQAAIQLMQQGYLNDKSIEGLCMTVGFNSRVTFFLSFKKYTGLNPTEYLRLHVRC